MVETAQPIFQQLQVSRILACTGKRYLVRTPVTLDFAPIHLLGAGPPLWAAQNYHWPARPGGLATITSLFLNMANLKHTLFERAGHFLMHQLDIVAFHKMRYP